MEQADAVRMSEIIDMLNCLVALSFDGYTGLKYTILSQCNDHGSKSFLTKLFQVADECRLKMIEMK